MFLVLLVFLGLVVVVVDLCLCDGDLGRCLMTVGHVFGQPVRAGVSRLTPLAPVRSIEKQATVTHNHSDLLQTVCA